MSMFRASLYIVVCTARNRLRVRLRRLREPRYLIGAIVGAAYLYFTFFARMRATRGEVRRRGTGAPPMLALAAVRGSAPGAVGLALMTMTALGWLLPFDSGLLDFSEAEIQFLFPAPVSRRALLIHRMIRSQIGLLFGGVIIGVAMPTFSGYARLRAGIAMWLLLCTAKVYFTGISLARARLGSGDARARRVAWVPVVTLTAALVIVGTAVFRAFARQTVANVQDVLIRIGEVATTGLPAVVLWPFIAVARPLFAPWPGPYLVALGWAALVMAATVVWVLQSDAAFQDAAAEVADRRSRQPEAPRASYRATSNGWALAPTGRPEIAFAWKAAMQTVRLVDKRSLLRIAVLLVGLMVAATTLGRGGGVASTLGAFSIVATLFTVLVAPQIVRVDLRQDLRHLELLKTWPVRPSAVVRGEMLWPGVLITGIAWTAIAVAFVASDAVFPQVRVGWRLASGVAMAIVAPALVFAQLTIHNGMALIFPAWVPLGDQRPRGLDAMGQRLITLTATWLTLVAGALPGAIAGGVIWFALWRLAGPAALVPAAGVGAAILMLEVLLATEALGPAYERLDVMAVERSE